MRIQSRWPYWNAKNASELLKLRDAEDDIKPQLTKMTANEYKIYTNIALTPLPGQVFSIIITLELPANTLILLQQVV